MQYTITFTPQSVANYLNDRYDTEITVEQVEEYWECFEDYFENYQCNLMGEHLWEDFSYVADGWGIPLLEENFVESI